MQEEAGMDLKIRKFWMWFVKNDELIRKALEHGSEANKAHLTRIFDNKVLEIGNFSWDIEEGNLRKYAFTVSPNRDRELLLLSKELVSRSPELSHWEFHYARPARTPDFSVRVFDEHMNPHHIGALHWKFLLTLKPNHTASILLEVPELGKIDHETCEEAADALITGILGEEHRILYIDSIEITGRLGKEFEDLTFPVSELVFRMRYLTASEI